MTTLPIGSWASLLRARNSVLLSVSLSFFACSPLAPKTLPAAAARDTAPHDANERKRVEAIRLRLDTLAHDAFSFWRSRGPDPKHGGFYGTLDRHGNPAAPSDKGCIQQARHLWSFSMWYARREKTAEVRAIADNVYRFFF